MTEKKPVKNDPVDHPSHYTQYAHEVIELTSKLNFTIGNAVKYILRAPFKGRYSEDMKKAVWYIKYEHEHYKDTPNCLPDTIDLAKSFNEPLVVTLIRVFGISNYYDRKEALDHLLLEIDNRILKRELEELKNEKAHTLAELNNKLNPSLPGMEEAIKGYQRMINVWAIPNGL